METLLCGPKKPPHSSVNAADNHSLLHSHLLQCMLTFNVADIIVSWDPDSVETSQWRDYFLCKHTFGHVLI